MRRLGHALLLGVLGAGLVHVAVILLLPLLSESDAWARVSAAAEPFATVRLDAHTEGGPVVASLDPLFMAAACRFDLGQGPLVVSARGRPSYWSASIIGPDGRNLYSFNDRAREDGALAFVVLSPAQLAERDVLAPIEGESGPAPESSTIFAEVDAAEGMVVVRAFVPDESFRSQTADFLTSLSCATEPE